MTDHELPKLEESKHDESVDRYIERIQTRNLTKDTQAPTVTQQPSKASIDGVTHMKINWKIIVALVVIAGAVFWAFDSTRSRSHSGSALNIGMGHGTVTLINSSDAPVPVQLMGTGTRGFSVTTNIDGVGGESVSEGTGRSTTQLFAFEAVPGTTEFTVESNTPVNFVTDTDTRLEAIVQPLSADEARATLIVAGIVILVALFFISNATGHRWLRTKQGFEAAQAAKALAENPVEPSQGRTMRSYGDNRAQP